MRKLDFNDKLIEIVHNKIRAFSPKPSAWFFYNNERIKIIEADFVKGDWKCFNNLNNLFHIGCKMEKCVQKLFSVKEKNL